MVYLWGATPPSSSFCSRHCSLFSLFPLLPSLALFCPPVCVFIYLLFYSAHCLSFCRLLPSSFLPSSSSIPTSVSSSHVLLTHRCLPSSSVFHLFPYFQSPLPSNLHPLSPSPFQPRFIFFFYRSLCLPFSIPTSISSSCPAPSPFAPYAAYSAVDLYSSHPTFHCQWATFQTSIVNLPVSHSWWILQKLWLTKYLTQSVWLASGVLTAYPCLNKLTFWHQVAQAGAPYYPPWPSKFITLSVSD